MNPTDKKNDVKIRKKNNKEGKIKKLYQYDFFLI